MKEIQRYYSAKWENIKNILNKTKRKKIFIITSFFIFLILLILIIFYNIIFLSIYSFFIVKYVKLLLSKKDVIIELKIDSNKTLIGYPFFIFYSLPRSLALITIYYKITKNKFRSSEIKIFFFNFLVRKIIGFPLWLIESSFRWSFFLLIPIDDVNWSKKKKKRWPFIYLESLKSNTYYIYLIYEEMESFMFSKKIKKINKEIKTNSEIDKFISNITYNMFKSGIIKKDFYKENITGYKHIFRPIIDYMSKDQIIIGQTETTKKSIKIYGEKEGNSLALINNEIGKTQNGKEQFVTNTIINSKKIYNIDIMKSRNLNKWSLLKYSFNAEIESMLLMEKVKKNEEEFFISQDIIKDKEYLTMRPFYDFKNEISRELFDKTDKRWEVVDNIINKELENFTIKDLIKDTDKDEFKRKVLINMKEKSVINLMNNIIEGASNYEDDKVINEIIDYKKFIQEDPDI